MKNKFKKSKIIVPALALITATTVASVTGTVAWFTASRAVTVSASQFTTTTEASSLEVDSVAINDCGVTAGTNGSATVNGLLTHGSYNAAANKTGNLYSPVIDDSANVISYNELGTVDSHLETGTTSGQGTTPQTNKWIAGTTTVSAQSKNIWYGVAWQLNFKQKNGNTNVVNNLLVDLGSCTFTDGDTTTSRTHTIEGFRIALMTSNNFVVLGGDEDTTHVSSTSATSEFTNYFKVKVGETAGSTYTAAVDATQTTENSTVTSNVGYLGTLNDDGTTVTSVTCVAWFEGCDTAHIVNQDTNSQDVIMSTVTASLRFYSRKTIKTA